MKIVGLEEHFATPGTRRRTRAASPSVRDAYYRGFGPGTDAALATFGIGRHYDAGVQLLRLIVGGVFDRFPEPQVIVGHWGEMVAFYLERIAKIPGAARRRALPRRGGSQRCGPEQDRLSELGLALRRDSALTQRRARPESNSRNMFGHSAARRSDSEGPLP